MKGLGRKRIGRRAYCIKQRGSGERKRDMEMLDKIMLTASLQLRSERVCQTFWLIRSFYMVRKKERKKKRENKIDGNFSENLKRERKFARTE